MELQTLAWGYTLPEAPRMDASGNLYFSDGLGAGGVHRLSSTGEVATVVKDRKLVGGLALHRDGGFVMAGKQVQHWREGSVRTLLELDGVYYFNDLHTDANGAVYVGAIRTDVEKLMEISATEGRESDRARGLVRPAECYRINVDGSVDELYDDVWIGNGIGFSPDYRTLYQVDSHARGIIVHDIDAAGVLSNRRFIGKASFSKGAPDGMCVDTEGNLWVADVGGGRIVTLSPSGDELSEIKLPATRVTSATFAGPDLTDMYVCAADNLEDPARGGSIFRIHPGARGMPTALATV
jgi:sugar lactone lactonase YvrE